MNIGRRDMELDFKLRWKDSFSDELDEIYEYLNYISKSSELSEKLILKLDKELKILKYFPESYPKAYVKNRYGYEYRKMVISKRYIVLYYIDYDDRVVYISHIFDGRSNYIRKLV